MKRVYILWTMTALSAPIGCAGSPVGGGSNGGNAAIGATGGIIGAETGGFDTGGAGLDAAHGTGTGGLGGSGTGGAAAGDAGTCSSDQDCPASQVCGYEADPTCSISAHCIAGQYCDSVRAGCGCDGGVVLVGCGVASRPFSGADPCAGGTGGAPSAATPVSVTQLMGRAVPSCAAGYAHPSICCQGAPYRATTCTEDATRPFDVCGPEQLAYPDANLCCSLDNKTICVQPSGVDSTADAGQSSTCHNPCRPGAYPPPPFLGSELCVLGTGMSVEPREPFCSLCTGPVQWCSTPCPAGWSAPAGGQVDLCCLADSSGRSFCFSQAGYIGSNDGGGGGTSDASACRFEQFLNDSNSYVVTCDFAGSGTCNCWFNGVVTQTFSAAQADAGVRNLCGISMCGFPSS
jgi:hypothetical protein